MIDPRSYVPVYRQLADILRGLIADGTLGPGAPLLPEKRMGDQYGVSRDTAKASLAELRAEGLIEMTPTGARVKIQPTREIYSVQRSSRVVTRMPTPAERTEHDIGEGTPVFEIRYGAKVIILPGDRFELVFK